MEFYHEAIYAEKGTELNTSRRRRGNKVKTKDINKKKNDVGKSKRRTTAIRTKTSKWLTKGCKIRVSCRDPTSVVRNSTACVYDPRGMKYTAPVSVEELRDTL
jgi:hypothetical protein